MTNTSSVGYVWPVLYNGNVSWTAGGGTDADAQAYFDAVALEDGEELPDNIKTVVNDYVVALKAASIWDTIELLVIPCVAQTHTAALIPLKGAYTQSGQNFFSGDYRRGTGVRGNDDFAQKSIATDLPGNFASQNDVSAGAYIRGNNDGQETIFGNVVAAGGINIAEDSLNNRYITVFCYSAGTSTINTGAVYTGYIGLHRNNSANFTFRRNGFSQTITSASAAPSTTKISVLARSNSYPGSGSNWDGRLAVYFFGAYCDPADMDTATTDFITALDALDLLNTLVDGPDADATTYLDAVEAADGGALPSGIRDTVDEYVRRLKAKNVWPKIYQMGLMMGPATLSGAIVPLKGPNISGLVNFSSSDYIPASGIVGNGTNRFLETGTTAADAGITRDDIAIGVWVSQPQVAFANEYFIGNGGSNPAGLSYDTGNNRLLYFANSGGGIISSAQQLDFMCTTRRVVDTHEGRMGNIFATDTDAPGTPNQLPFCVLGRSLVNSYTDGTVGMYFIGPSQYSTADFREATVIAVSGIRNTLG